MNYLEGSLQGRCLKYLRTKPTIYVLNTRGSSFMTIGTPDLILCINGHFVVCELKVGKNDLSPAQRVNRERVLEAGGKYHVPRTLEEFIDVVRIYEK